MTRDRRTFGRLRKLPSGRYQAAYIGPDDKLHTATSTFGAKVDAEAWLTDRRREIDRDLWSPPATGEQKKAKRKADVKFGDYAETWVATRTVKGKPLRPRTQAHYRSLLKQHILPTFENKAISRITRESIERWYNKTASDTPTLRAHAYSLLRTILESARTRDKLIDVNPCAIEGAGSSDRVIKPKPATYEQLDTLVGEMPARLQLMVLLAAWCAMRFGELVELRRKDIDIEEAVVKIRRAAVRVDGGWAVGDPKTDAGKREVAIPPHILPAVERHLTNHTEPEQNALLFPPRSGEHMQPSTLYRHFYRARAAAKPPICAGMIYAIREQCWQPRRAPPSRNSWRALDIRHTRPRCGTSTRPRAETS